MKAAIIFLLYVFTCTAGNVLITGRVVSVEDGTPLSGVTIRVPQTSIGTVTSQSGYFSLLVDTSIVYTLSVSAVGFDTKSVRVSFFLNDSIPLNLNPAPVLANAVVITANKTEQSLADVPVSMNIVQAQAIVERNSISIDDALRYVPGVNFQQTQINIRASSGYSRGVGTRVLLLLDGVPLLTGDTGEIPFESIPVLQVDRIEVVKGPGSALYGSGALGGVVNVITKDASPHPLFWWKVYSARYASSPYPEWHWSDKSRFTNGQYLGYSNTSDKLEYSISLRRSLDDGYRENDWMRRYGGYVKLKYTFDPYQSLTFSSNIFQQYRGNFLWWKDIHHALQPADAQENISTTSLRMNTSLHYKNFVSEKFYYDLTMIHFRGNWHTDSLSNVRLDGSISDAVVMDLQGTAVLDNLNTATFGIVWNADRVRSNIFGRHDGAGGALYLQDQWMPENNISITAGVRYDGQKVIGLTPGEQFNPKLGVRFTLDGNSTLRTSIGRGFRSPSISEYYTSTSNTGSAAIVVPNTSLRPEHTWSYEFGGTHRFGDDVMADAALFQSDYSDLIEPRVGLDSTISTTSAIISFQNITQARIQGFETSLTMYMFEHSLLYDIHYNYNWAVDRSTGTFLRFRPRHIAGIHLSYEYQLLRCGIDFRYISRIEEIDENLVRLAPIKNGDERIPTYLLDSHIIINLTRYGIPMNVSVVVNNMLNYHYVELIGNIAPPRQIVLSLEGIIE